MKLLLFVMFFSGLLFADCTPSAKQEADKLWKKAIFQESNLKLKQKTLNKAYKLCRLKKIYIDKQIAYLSTLSKNDLKKHKEEILDLAIENQKLVSSGVSKKHIANNQIKINKLLGIKTEGTLKAVEYVGGSYSADIKFDYNSAKLKEDKLLKKVANKIISEVKKNKDAVFGLTGGASSEGSASYNKQLSKRRAEAVKEYILLQDISLKNNIITYAVGETELVCEGGFPPEVDIDGNSKCITKEDKEASRRVTIRRER